MIALLCSIFVAIVVAMYAVSLAWVFKLWIDQRMADRSELARGRRMLVTATRERAEIDAAASDAASRGAASRDLASNDTKPPQTTKAAG